MTRFIAEARTGHFILVAPKVVRELGSANHALVYIRMAWRCEEERAGHSVAGNGRIWWEATAAVVASETGLTVEQARYSLEQLVAKGWVKVWDQGRGLARRYAPDRNIPTPSEDSETPSGPSEGGVSEGPDSLLLIETAASGGENLKTVRVDVPGLMFEEAWKHWPRSESKKKALDKFLRLPNQREVAAAIIAHGDAHRAHSGEYVPYLVTWLNGERWNDPLPTPKRQGAARQDQQLAMIGRYEQQEVTQRALES